jgi:hypothetical protein
MVLLSWCEDADPEADPSPPPPRRTTLHSPHAPPPPPRAPPLVVLLHRVLSSAIEGVLEPHSI